jgi:excisionase family DNA binding protein
MSVDSKYFSIQEAAAVLGVDEEQVLSLVHSGDLIAFNVAKSLQGKRPRWRIAEADLAKFLMARRHPASTQPAPAAKATKRPTPKQYV